MICLTFDTDWMTEAALAQFLATFPIPGRATFFCHARFECLSDTPHEICTHPFISNLATWQDELVALGERVGARGAGVRAHSCVFSHMIGIGLRELGFTYVSQAHALYQPAVRPVRHPWGVWELPIYYMDNMDFWMAANWPDINHEPFSPVWIDASITTPGVYVFDFHPLHIALNTPTAEYYQSVKERIVNGEESPFDLAFDGRGTRHYFLELCAAMRAAGEQSRTCTEALIGSNCVNDNATSRSARL